MNTIYSSPWQIALLFLLAMLLGPMGCADRRAATVLVEAEQFGNFGGWVLDQQFMDQMGSPYLLAHGLGDPVKDASTQVRFPQAGEYKVWVRTRDWVAPWKAPGAPGKFQLLIDGQPLPTTFGTEGEAWHWQSGGVAKVKSNSIIALHDLTGFEGRCDAIVFSSDPMFVPPENVSDLTPFRRQMLNIPDEPEDGGQYDVVIVGGGIAGSASAVTAARMGLSVALIQDRPVLGGNGSSEVRVWPEGYTNQKPYERIGDVVRELVPDKSPSTGNAKGAAIYADQRKVDVVQSEKNIALRLEQRVNEVDAQNGQIRSVVAQHVRTGHRYRYTGRYFVDCTGDGAVGALGGADFEITAEDHMGASNLWGVVETKNEEPFPKCLCEDNDPLGSSTAATTQKVNFPRLNWAIDLKDKDFPGRKNNKGQWKGAGLSNLGDWFWESGFDRDPINDVERMRDLNLRAMYGAWDVLKNVDGLYPNHQLTWAAYIAGKRESRRLLGDLQISADDFRKGTAFPDAAFPCSWHIDLHLPDPAFADGHDGEEFISRATEGKEYQYKVPYWAPYRTLYSRNVRNLFMAGRDISVSHDALGAVRVMRTCGMMGEAVGLAASICAKYHCTPRDVYQSHLAEYVELLRAGAGKNSPAIKK